MWLLMLALPVQGLATSAMLLCAAGHHGTARDGHDQAAHSHPGDASSLGSGVQSEPGHDAASSPLAAKHSDLVKGKCSACGACCMAAYLPTAAMEFSASPIAVAPSSFTSTPSARFFTDGPDRPPRIFLV